MSVIHMFFQIALLNTSIIAVITFIKFFSSMSSRVLSQIFCRMKSFVAVFTSMSFYIIVTSLMLT